MKSNFKAVDWFVTTIKAGSSIAATGTSGSFNVTSKSVNGEILADGDYFFFVTVKGEDSVQREIFRIWRVAGDVLYFDQRKSPGGLFLHAAGESVQVNDVAESINFAFETIDDFGKTEDGGGLTVKVTGGKVQVGTTSYSVATTTLTLADNSSLSVVFDTADQTFKSAATVGDTHIIMASVTTASGDISSLGDLRPYNYTPLSGVPGSSIATLSYGLAKSDGTLTTYARADHTHGTPALPSASQLNGTMDGQARGIKDGAWVAVSEAGSSIPEAPSDGKTYGRNNAAWTEVTSGGDVLLAANNAFTGDNTFAGTSQFDDVATFTSTAVCAYVNPTPAAGSVTIDFTTANTAAVIISSATAFTIQGMHPGNAYCIAVTSQTGGSISALTMKQISGATLTKYAPGGVIPDVSAAGQYLLSIYAGSTAADIYVSQKATIIT